MIQQERIKALNTRSIRKGAYVLYWMQASQRAEYNHALEYAIAQGNEQRRPVVVFIGITERFPEANQRHYAFMLEGLREVRKSLEKRGLLMAILLESPEKAAVRMARKASLVIVDRGYLRIQREWRDVVAAQIDCPLLQVESDVIVPIEAVSPKEEYAAATIRTKIHNQLSRFLVPLKPAVPAVPSLSLDIESLDIRDIEGALSKLDVNQSVSRVGFFQGGTEAAKKRLQVFLDKKLDHFPDKRNDPTVDYLSQLSPYLHFGQISPLYVALKALETGSQGTEAFLEELVVRRELSMNFVFYNRNYDSYACIPEWARKTLKRHQKDQRPYIYELEELEQGRTHDPYWNAAQKEMVVRGKMHGYMRMYWGKKILEWSRKPEIAFQTALYLNNKYELDGRDPNGFAGVAWCFGKHDRPWGERQVFGNVRYLNDNGLKRKFDADAYVRKMDNIKEL